MSDSVTKYKDMNHREIKITIEKEKKKQKKHKN
jgi:hypothetical protein